MTRTLLLGAAMALVSLGQTAAAQEAPGQDPMLAGLEALSAALGNTEITWRSHSVAAGGSTFAAEGTSCPANTKMLSGACHPGYSDQVILINQYPNIAANTWRCGFKNNSASARTAWVYTLCAADTPSGPPAVQHDLSVRRFSSTPLTNADADRIMADATTVAQTADFAGDVACKIEMRRSGNVTAFTTGDGSIDSSAEFSAVIGEAGWIKAVNQINWCGSIGAGIIGCAPVPGSSFAIVRYTASLEGILWLHEFAHNKGRSHRNGTSNVMHPSIGASRLGLNTDECNALSVPSPALGEAAVILAAGSGSEGATDAMDSGVEAPPDVRDFVRQHFFHGVPYDVARSYGADDVPALLEMLGDPAEDEWQTNVVAVLGMIGSDETVYDPLVAYLEAESDSLSPDLYRAKATVPLALGYLANQTGSGRAVDYLIAAADPAYWAGKEVGQATFQAAAAERDADLATKAILGLALSGSDRAFEALAAMQERGVPGMPGAESVIVESLEANREIAEEGLSDYYDGQ